MADINSAALDAAKDRIESLVPGAKIKSIVRMNHFYIFNKGLQIYKREFRNVMWQRKRMSRR